MVIIKLFATTVTIVVLCRSVFSFSPYKNEYHGMCDLAAGFIQNYQLMQGWKCNGNSYIFDVCNDSVSTWDGVECQVDSVIGISLVGYGIAGTISDSIGNLTNLQYLRLDYNSLEGKVPSSLGFLSNLQYFSLFSNKLTGHIPTNIFQLTSLYYLDISSNMISGSIPIEIGNMVQLGQLRLDTNMLAGEIPASIGYLSYLYLLGLASNYLTGVIPTSIGFLTNLYSINLSLNNLTGTIPSSFGLLSNSFGIFYLNNNALTGTIPFFLSNLSLVYFFDISYNSLTGPIPHWLWEMPSLQAFLMIGNKLSGTIPSTIGLATNFISFEISTNQLTGTLPTTIGYLSQIYVIAFSENKLVGTIPTEIGSMNNLVYFKSHSNSLTGSIPSTLFLLENLLLCFLYLNQLSGPIPSELSRNTNLLYLDLNDNQLTGPIPENIGNCTSLVRMTLTNNFMSGSIPTSLGNVTALQNLYLSNNRFTGKLPTALGYLKQLYYLDCHNNELTSTLPTSLSLLSSLKEIYLRNNVFFGSIENVFDSSTQKNLRNIDISNNYLTGTIPSTWFNSSSLEVFAATSNCLIFPELANICRAHHLKVLSLDGLQTAENCRNFFFSGSGAQTYALRRKIHMSIPLCLYTLPQLEVLHLSGNALTGTIPSDITLGDTLTDLTLSYNRLRGSIPEAIQRRNWTTLDLSYNCLSGTLSQSIPSVTKSKFSVNINRLSGLIPDSLLDSVSSPSADISVVKGNIFRCDFDGDRLPSGDSNSPSYNCGSDTFLLALYIFLGILFFSALILLFFTYRGGLTSGTFNITISDRGTALTKLIFKMLGLGLMLTVFIVCVMMPVFGALSIHYGTHTYEYAWSVSAGFLSGHNAKVIMLVIWSGMLLYFIVVYKVLFRPSKTDDKLVIFPEATAMPEIDANPRGLVWDNIVQSVLLLVNMVVVFAANAGYVLATLRADAYTIILVQILLGIFKVIWRYGYIEYIGYYRDCITGHTHRNRHDLFFLTFMLVFNNVVIPVFSEAVIDSNCIYNIFMSPEPVTTSYDYDVCLSEPFRSKSCVVYSHQSAAISYAPPFIYRHQCCSTIIKNYVSVYSYMFVFTALQIPMSWIVVWIRSRFLANGIIHQLLGLGVHQLHSDTPYLNYPLYVAGTISSLAVLVTFGAAFPPLAAIIFIALYIDAVLVTAALPPEPVPILIDELGIVLYLVPFSAVFFSFFLYDTADYQIDVWASLWAPMTIIVMPLVMLFVNSSAHRWRSKRTSRRNLYRANEDTDTIFRELNVLTANLMATVSANTRGMNTSQDYTNNSGELIYPEELVDLPLPLPDRTATDGHKVIEIESDP